MRGLRSYAGEKTREASGVARRPQVTVPVLSLIALGWLACAGGSLPDGGDERPDDGAAKNFGTLLIENVATRDGEGLPPSYFNQILGRFGASATEDCRVEAMGVCSVTTCEVRLPPPPNPQSVGTLLFRGFSFVESPSPISLAFPYSVASARPRKLWDGGELLEVIAEDFSLQTRAPTPMLVMTTCPSGGCSDTLDRTTPLRVRWNAGEHGQPVIVLEHRRYLQSANGLQLVTVGAVECLFEAAAVEGEVDAAVLSALSPYLDGNPDDAMLSVLRRSSSVVETTQGRIVLNAEWVAERRPVRW